MRYASFLSVSVGKDLHGETSVHKPAICDLVRTAAKYVRLTNNWKWGTLMSICDALRQRVGMLLTYFGLVDSRWIVFLFWASRTLICWIDCSTKVSCFFSINLILTRYKRLHTNLRIRIDCGIECSTEYVSVCAHRARTEMKNRLKVTQRIAKLFALRSSDSCWRLHECNAIPFRN